MEAEIARTESMELIYVSLLLASVCLIFLALKIIKCKQQSRKECGREVPGPWTLPFIGSLHHLLGSKLPHRTFRDLSTIYGPIMRLKLGEINTVVISSAEAAREIMKTHDIVFSTRPINTTIAAMSYGGKGIVFGPYGEVWRQMRRICNLELLSAKRVRSFRLVREEEVSRLVRSLATASGTPVNFSRSMAAVTNEIIGRAVGRCDDQKLFFSALSYVMEFGTGFSAVDMFPSLSFLGHVNGYYRRLEQCRRELDRLAESIVEEHRDKMAERRMVEDDEEALMEEDLTDVLLRIQRKDYLPFPITDNIIKAVVNDMLFAGSESTATALEWVMSELIQNPNIMKKVQREIRTALGSIGTHGKLVDEEALSGRFPYLQSVIMEALRLHPTGPLLLPRQNQERCEVMGYEIPAKTTVVVNMWAIARDERYWESPDCFWPERFEESSLDFKGVHFEYTPFGAGRRICPGMQFGLATMEIILVFLLYYFDWEYLGKNLDMTEAFGITVRRESPLCIVPTLHFPLPSQTSTNV